ncbi:DoxX family protein [Nocardiopsis sp. N85]|uniref:DoxX family protein n=1 Tax=Nocardiopsis sp. N85 TaxID=3029400 RepID=UPI00237F1E72|nr:DoxX family protein [Nocardiopsis sp. N85]MDE3722661.1 DoxX family protein [Nocardiopsis sp. N85]
MQRSTPHSRRRRPRPRPRVRLRRRGLYDIGAALTRVGVGWVFADHGLALRGRESPLATHLTEAGTPLPGFLVPLLPALIVAASLSFAVGLLTWTAGPLLALCALLGALAPGSPNLSPFDSLPVTVLVTAVCLLMAVNGGRWSWDHLVLAPEAPERPEHLGRRRRHPNVTSGKPPAISTRRPEHAPPLLYPVGQAAVRRPYQL